MIMVPKIDQNMFEVGKSMNLVCEVDPSSTYKMPTWRAPNGLIVPERTLSKYLH